MKRFTLSTLAGAMLAAISSASMASSHREAPFITENPKVDATDFYLFRSYEPNREDYVTLIANYNPLQDAYGGPNYFSLSPEALYEIHVDNNGDAVEDVSFQFKFTKALGNAGAGISLDINGKDMAVPLKNIGPVTSTDDSALNFKESYSLTMVDGDRRTGNKTPVLNDSDGSTSFAKPLDNIGDKTFSQQSYDQYANSFIYDVNLSSCPEGAQDGRVFVGQRKESFAVNLGEIFDLVNTNPVGPVDGESNQLADKNITTFALEVPIACLGEDNDVIAAWTSASLPQVRVLDPNPSFTQPLVSGGAWTQVSRLGMPLVNEVVIGLPDKNRFNASEPKDDAQFADYVTNPTLPTLLQVLFGVKAPTVENRPDLVAAFLTGFTGVNANGSVAEMQRLNTAIAPTIKAEQNNLGVAAGDNAGFPNGRRPGDDTVDAALRVSMGLLCHLPLDLCTPEQAESGTLAYTDGVLQNAAQFDDSFPYLTTPISGATSDVSNN
ncbi:MAG: FIG00729359: hypothetical protein [uncultured Thiotrichaceae bacterium]|uniref:DUF4331 domain-containing protein n=1 Tax=uncultured Thiotrichaceae bacterium TaxID=298394 RepID=A0A6S6TVK8_9GAMM|nr:MAG: FIG00729359: hypothetical protein [uncultured Thiotrichaceae bacterium]